MCERPVPSSYRQFWEIRSGCSADKRNITVQKKVRRICLVPCSCEFGVVLPLQTGSSWQDRQCVFRQLQGTSLGDKSPYLTRIQMEPSTGSSASMHLSQSCAGKVCDNCRLGLACRLYTVKIMLPHFMLINVHYTSFPFSIKKARKISLLNHPEENKKGINKILWI